MAKGSAGSGKSVNTAQDFILKLMNPKYKGSNLLVVRKIDESNRDSTYAELLAAIYKICGEMATTLWTIKSSPLELICKTTGNKVIFRGMKDDSQKEKVKSISFAIGKLCWIWIEEATELQEADIDILDDRLRGELPEGLFYQMTFTFNPVSINHWIKAKYFDTPNPHVFPHHSTYKTNRFIDKAYHDRMALRAIQDPDGYRVYGLGEWGLLGGQFFSIWKDHLHVCNPFKIPSGWIKFRAMDWGSYRPYSVGWYAVNYDGRIYKYRELYGYGGKPNIGTKESSKQVAEKIVELEKDEHDIAYAVLDNACWNSTGTEGPTIAEEMNKVLFDNKKTLFGKSKKGREQGAEQVKLRLEGYKDAAGKDVPTLVFFSTCFHTIRTIPSLTHDKNSPEKVDTNGEDHAFDETVYACLSRPWIPELEREDKKKSKRRRKREAKNNDWMAM